jgi:hypothetical protein
VPTLDDVAAIALELPGSIEGERHAGRVWSVGKKAFAWERPLTKADVRRFGAAPVPPGPLVAVRVEDLMEKEAVLAAGTRGVFTIPHFDGYAAVLIELPLVPKRALRELVMDGWAAVAPPAVVTAHAASRRRRSSRA